MVFLFVCLIFNEPENIYPAFLLCLCALVGKCACTPDERVCEGSGKWPGLGARFCSFVCVCVCVCVLSETLGGGFHVPSRPERGKDGDVREGRRSRAGIFPSLLSSTECFQRPLQPCPAGLA
uniref:Secreted protein n=1 Tax=Rousettus aegyptiacus TaxID=9407 RepID=A0A7J8HSW0_ROUAE|nr:hypothetical protein HJG63_011093 [Rousettus aegyptiacus]